MTTTYNVSGGSAAAPIDNERLLGIYGMLLGFLSSFMIAIFWSMGAILKVTGNGGTIVQLDLQGLWNTLFWAFPYVAAGSVVLAVGAFAAGRAKEAAGISMLPTIGVVLYYFALVMLR